MTKLRNTLDSNSNTVNNLTLPTQGSDITNRRYISNVMSFSFVQQNEPLNPVSGEVWREIDPLLPYPIQDWVWDDNASLWVSREIRRDTLYERINGGGTQSNYPVAIDTTPSGSTTPMGVRLLKAHWSIRCGSGNNTLNYWTYQVRLRTNNNLANIGSNPLFLTDTATANSAINGVTVFNADLTTAFGSNQNVNLVKIATGNPNTSGHTLTLSYQLIRV